MARQTALKPRSGGDSLRSRLIAKVHVLKAQHGLDDDTYRDLLEQVTGQRSAARCSIEQLDAVVARLGGDKALTSASVSGPYAAKVRALWLSGWHLGLVRDRSDQAMTAFVRRQTGIDAVRWLRSSADAMRVIEALKSWLARDAGVEWAAWPDNPRAAVAHAQWRLMLANGVARIDFTPDGPEGALERYATRVVSKSSSAWFSDEDWDRLIVALGRKLRANFCAAAPP